MDFSARLAGLKILARYSQTGLGFSARAELRPGLNISPCNRQFGFQRICYRSRAEISAWLAGLLRNSYSPDTFLLYTNKLDSMASSLESLLAHRRAKEAARSRGIINHNLTANHLN